MAEFIPFSIHKGEKNMQIDSAIMAESIKNRNKPVLRLYGWELPTLTIGRNQDLYGINVDFCHKNNIDIVKRPTGGRAVLHHHELTYSFVAPQEFLQNAKSVIASYREISEAFVIAFNDLGINLDFPENKKKYLSNEYCMAISTGADLSYNGKKLIGSAQYRSNGYILQHGSILIDMDKSLLAGIFGIQEKDCTHITLKEINPQIADIPILSATIKKGFETKFDIKFKNV